MKYNKASVIIIGAGPAGLATAAELGLKKRSYIILEKGDMVAQSWQKHYDRLHLHTVRDFSHLPNEPFPETYPQFVHKDDLLKYYQAYAEKYEIAPLFNHNFESIKKDNND